jgi:hypothetical protein
MSLPYSLSKLWMMRSSMSARCYFLNMRYFMPLLRAIAIEVRFFWKVDPSLYFFFFFKRVWDEFLRYYYLPF